MTIKKALFLLTFFLLAIRVHAQQNVINLWPGVAPGSENENQKESDIWGEPVNAHLVRNITTPTLTIFTPRAGTANGTAVIICPGGGFQFLSIDSEGMEVAKRLSDRGVTAFVLKYRTQRTPDADTAFRRYVTNLFFSGKNRPAETSKSKEERMNAVNKAIADGLQAMRLVRQQAKKWDIDPNRIGIIGFSAGAQLTMGVITGSDSDTHPDFAAPIYGGAPVATPIGNNAPPLFLACAADDQASVNMSKLFVQWKEAGHSAELHIYAKGGHGFGMKKQGLPTDSWIDRLGDWLNQQGLMKPRNAGHN